MKRTAISIALACFALALTAGPSLAVKGDHYGAAPINDHPEATPIDGDALANGREQVPALPGYRHAFWAGACDRAAAPGFDQPIAGGIGARPSTVLVGTMQLPAPPFGIFDETRAQIPAPAPATPEHCIDQGAVSIYQAQSHIWQHFPYDWTGFAPPGVAAPAGGPSDYAPSWRLAPLTQAGARSDGTSMLAWARDADEVIPHARVDGSPDNVRVDLPPGFVANPQAVPQCTAEQFDARRIACPPQTQVGLLRLNIQPGTGGDANIGGLQGANDTSVPVYNLEPRQGNVAELGFAHVGYGRQVAVRLVADVRTDGDFGVTGFVGQIPAGLAPIQNSVTIWAVPWAAENDVWRPAAAVNHLPSPCTNQPGGASAPDINYIPWSGLSPACQVKYEPSWGPIRPFVSNETDCNPAPVVRLQTDTYHFPGAFVNGTSFTGGRPDTPAYPWPHPSSDVDESTNWKTYTSLSPQVTGCELLDFDPTITLDPKGQGGAANQATDSPAGLDVELTIPQNNDLPFAAPVDGAPQPEVDDYLADARAYWRSPAGLATAHLRDTTVTLPDGMTLNPAAAHGQGVCTMAQIGVTDASSPEPPRVRFNDAPVACPESSKVAEVVVETPLLAPADWPEGNVYLAAQGDNPFNSDFAIYIALEIPQRGFIAKLAGEVKPDPTTGRLTTTFLDNPELPFDTFKLRFKAGPTAPLATPQTCGTHTNVSSFASHARPNNPVAVNDPFPITSSPAGGCPASKAERPFNLGFAAGSTEVIGGAHSPFTVRLTRPDGNQEFGNVEVTTPPGFAAKLAGVATCSDASVKAVEARTATGDGAKEQQSPSCPDSSKIGTTTIGVGAGSSPFYAKGNVYLAGPYKGAPLSLAFIVPAVAGPFDLGVQVVRAAVKVNPVTAQITTTSDAIPQILEGVPLRIRDIRVDVDRKDFAINPTDCSEKLVSGKVTGSHGASTEVSNRFQVAECARLAFKPQVSLQLFGGVTRAKYQGVRAIVRPRPGDANISGATVRFPSSAFVAQEHLQNICTRVQWAADACPKNSVYGVAEAISPLLDEPLKGNVHLRSSNNLLPDLVADLRGPAHQPIKVEVAIRNDSVKGALRNTVDVAPDTPVSFFRIQVFGGKKALITNSRNICKDKNAARVSFRAHNGRSSVQSVAVRNAKCGKWRKAQKRKVAKRKAAAKRKARAQQRH